MQPILMADYQKVEERLISGKGVLKIPSDMDEFRHAYLTLDVIRDASSKYLNLNWNPPQSKYAFLVFRRNEYVVSSAYMQWEREMYDTVPDITSQNLIAIKCAYDGILQTFFNLGNALQLPSISITDLIKDYESLTLQWDEILIKCYADTAIQARLYVLEDDSCTADRKKRKPIPPPETPLPKVPSGTPIGDISSPYNPDTDDEGNTEPFPEDSFPAPQPCVTFIIGRGLNVNTCQPLTPPQTFEYLGYATLQPVTVGNNCPGLRLFINGIDQGVSNTFFPDAFIDRREGDCPTP